MFRLCRLAAFALWALTMGLPCFGKTLADFDNYGQCVKFCSCRPMTLVKTYCESFLVPAVFETQEECTSAFHEAEDVYALFGFPVGIPLSLTEITSLCTSCVCNAVEDVDELCDTAGLEEGCVEEAAAICSLVDGEDPNEPDSLCIQSP